MKIFFPKHFNPARSSIQFDNPWYALGPVAGFMAGEKKKEKDARRAANAAVDQAKNEAEAKALAETQEKEKTDTARRRLLGQSTSGFGPNSNLARSFLTSL